MPIVFKNGSKILSLASKPGTSNIIYRSNSTLCFSLSTHLTARLHARLTVSLSGQNPSGHLFPPFVSSSFLFLARSSSLIIGQGMSGCTWLGGLCPRARATKLAPWNIIFAQRLDALYGWDWGLHISHAQGYISAQGSCQLQYLDVSPDSARWRKCQKKSSSKWNECIERNLEGLVLCAQMRWSLTTGQCQKGLGGGGRASKEMTGKAVSDKSQFPLPGKIMVDRCTSIHAFLCFNFFICEIQFRRSA